MQNWMPKDDSCSKCPGCKQDLLHSQPKVRVLLIDYTLKYLFCHQDCNIDDVIDNHFTRQMQSVKSQLEKEVQTCTNCEENGTAVSFCLDCSEWLCGVCVIAHQRVRLTKDHNIQSKENVDLQSASSLPKLLRCSIHKENNESRLIQCMSCESLTEIGTHCQHCNAPVSQRISPKKASSILSEGPPVLEKEVNFVLQEAIEIDETEAKTQKILTEEHRTLLPPVPIIDNVHEISDDEIDRTLISSSDDEYYPSRKRPKRKCKKSPFPTPVSSAPSRRGRGRSRLVAPKVVIESSATVEEIEKPSDTPQTSRFEQSNIKQIPISSPSTKPTPVNFGNLCDLRELSLKCRSIRIGSLKTVPQMPINLSLNGIEMVITNPQDISTQSCNIVIPSKDIVQIMCHFGRSLPIMYVYTNTRFSDDIVKKFGKEIYSPSGQDEAKKRIIILPDKFADEDRLIIKNIFKDISVNQKRHNLFAELDVKSANALLVGSTPHEKKK